MKKVLILPIVLPEFRVPLYNQLAQNRDLDITVLHGTISKPVFAGATPREFRDISVPTIEKNIFGFLFTWQWGVVRRALFDNYDVVVLQGNYGVAAFYPVLLGRRLMRKKTFVWTCGYERPEISGLKKTIRDTLGRFFLRFCDGAVAYSNFAKDYLISMGMLCERIVVAGNTSDILPLHQKIKALDRQSCREELELKGKVVLFVGKFTRAKQLDLLVRSFAYLARLDEDYTLILMGGGPAENELKQLVSSLGISRYVRFSGVVIEGKEKYFRAADLAVMPGSGGLFINECMTAGLPILLSYSDGTHLDLIHDGRTGFLFRRDDEVDLSTKMACILADNILRKEVAQRAEEFVLANYSIEKMAEQIGSKIRQVNA